MNNKNYADSTENAMMQWFLAFYLEYRNIIYHMVRHRNCNQDDAEDMMQEVLLRLINHCDKLQTLYTSAPGKLSAYLASVVNSVYVDQFRKCKPTKLVYIPYEELLQSAANESMQKYYAQRYTWQTIQYLRENISKRDWILLKGKYCDGLSHHELSKLTGYTYASVRMALSRASKRAKKILQDWDGELP